VEALAAPYVVVREARANAALSKRLGLGSGEAAMRGDFARIAMAASRADPTCAAMIESSAEHLARALVSLVNVLDVDHLYLAGPAFADAGSLYLRIIRERLDAYAFLRAVHPVHIELSRVGPDAPALGAAAVLLQSELTPRNRALARA
jgi:predicted NBD/HSP70 family sugar kinase